MIDGKTIIVIGNGKSISNVKWDKLSDVATFGINGSFKLWNDIRWYPTYHYLGRRHDDQWKDGLSLFMNTNECINVFFNRLNYPELTAYGVSSRPIDFLEYPKYSPDQEKWENPFMYDVSVALGMIMKTQGVDFAQNVVDNMPDDIDNNLNPYGIFKVLMGLEKNIRETDYITKKRFNPEMMKPLSFNEFYYNGGMSGEIACLISYLLGYNRIILIGCDNDFVVNKDGTMRQKSSYGIKDMFYGKKYNTKEDIACPVCRTTEGLRDAMREWWNHLSAMIEMWDMDLKVYNAAPVDNIGVFPRMNLNDELGFDVGIKYPKVK